MLYRIAALVVVALLAAAPAAAAAAEPLWPGRPASPTFHVSLDDADLRQQQQQQQMLGRLWAFASLNYLYCDVVGLMDANMLRQYQSGTVNGVPMNENFLLGATLMMQVPLSMVFLSVALPPRASRIANISAGTFMTTVQTATLLVGRPTRYYLASSIIEIGTTAFITVYAWRRMRPDARVTPTLGLHDETTTVGLQVAF